MRIAVICGVYNEQLFLPQFLDHYSPQVDTVFIMDNESTDRTRDIAVKWANVSLSTYASGGELRLECLDNAYTKKRRECAGKFDYVVMLDVDEFVVPKAGGTIRDCVLKFPDREYFSTHGFDMWARPDDPPYNPSIPIIFQRRWGLETPSLSKTIILRPESSAKHNMGRHKMTNVDNGPLKDPSLALFYLLHYGGVSMEEYVRRKMSNTRRYSSEDRRKGRTKVYLNRDEEITRDEFVRFSNHPAAVDVVGMIGLGRARP